MAPLLTNVLQRPTLVSRVSEAQAQDTEKPASVTAAKQSLLTAKNVRVLQDAQTVANWYDLQFRQFQPGLLELQPVFLAWGESAPHCGGGCVLALEQQLAIPH